MFNKNFNQATFKISLYSAPETELGDESSLAIRILIVERYEQFENELLLTLDEWKGIIKFLKETLTKRRPDDGVTFCTGFNINRGELLYSPDQVESLKNLRKIVERQIREIKDDPLKSEEVREGSIKGLQYMVDKLANEVESDQNEWFARQIKLVHHGRNVYLTREDLIEFRLQCLKFDRIVNKK